MAGLYDYTGTTEDVILDLFDCLGQLCTEKVDLAKWDEFIIKVHSVVAMMEATFPLVMVSLTLIHSVSNPTIPYIALRNICIAEVNRIYVYHFYINYRVLEYNHTSSCPHRRADENIWSTTQYLVSEINVIYILLRFNKITHV